MVKSVILILWMTLPNGHTYWAPSQYFETEHQCHIEMARIAGTLAKGTNHYRYVCGRIIPPVEGK